MNPACLGLFANTSCVAAANWAYEMGTYLSFFLLQIELK
jgi:hypothetical protein